jgi:hypothetical protein
MRAADAARPLNSASFADLLKLAREGKVSSDRPVDVSPKLDLELTQAQQERVAWAVDRAEASGARSALVMLDGEALLVDVMTRRIEGVAQQPGEVMTAVDAVVIAPREDGTIGSDEAGLLGAPMEKISNQSLRDLLGQLAAGT